MSGLTKLLPIQSELQVVFTSSKQCETYLARVAWLGQIMTKLALLTA